jgi:nicotinamide riboside kinase
VAVLGAESTGKSSLIAELSQALIGLGFDVRRVHEYLRDWCTSQGRTPVAREQLAIAQEQARRARAAAESAQAHATTVVLSDTSALMTAVYSDLLFGDPSLLAFGLAQQKHFDMTLVTGLDLPWVADGLQRDGVQSQAPVDKRLREILVQNEIAFDVIYGLGPQRADNALRLLQRRLGCLPPAPEQRPWTCDKCSDPTCEHRLFTSLIQADSR